MADAVRGAGPPTRASPTSRVVLVVGVRPRRRHRGARRSGARGDDGERGEGSRAPAAAVKAPPPINTAIEGLTTFRGNASRSYYGEGPVPA